MQDSHDRCPHISAIAGFYPWRPRSSAEQVVTVCVCDCHAGCPLAGRGSVTQEVWGQRCGCPGADLRRQRQERTEQLRLGVADVVAEVKREQRPSAEGIESRLRAVYLRHGEPPPPGLPGWSRIAAAGTARRGTRTPRLLAMGIRAVVGTVRWAWEPGGENRAEARAVYRGAGVLALVAALLTATAAGSSGARRRTTGAGAVVAWLAAIWITVLGTVMAGIGRLAEDHPAPGELRP